MSGRFFSAPLVVAAGLLANQATIAKPVVRVGTVVIVMLAFMAPNPTLLSGRDYHDERLHTDALIDDERGYRFRFAGMISDRESPFLINDTWYAEGIEAREQAEAVGKTLVIVDPNGGYMGYAAGPSVHYINPYGITDPLLARLPGTLHGPGHFWRHPPAGYTRAAIGEGELHDPNLDAYWNELSLITRGPIWSKARWAAIWRMHTGANSHLRDAYLHTRLHYDQVSGEHADPIALRNGGAAIVLDGVRNDDLIEVHVELDDVYAVELFRAGERIYRLEFGETASTRKNRLVLYRITLPAEVAEAGYDEIRVLPVDGDGWYRMGRLRVANRNRAEK